MEYPTIFDTKKKRGILSPKECKTWENKFVQSDTAKAAKAKALKQAIYAETEVYINKILALRAELG